MVSAVAVGAFGEVYLVRDLSGISLALKLLKADSGAEASAIAELRQKVGNESGLVLIHHVGEFEGRVYYTMDAADNAVLVRMVSHAARVHAHAHQLR